MTDTLQITAQQLLAIMPDAGPRAAQFAQPLTDAMAQYDINTPERAAAFLATIAEESNELRELREEASGIAYEPPSAAARVLGNSQPGDGERFKGRGLGQATGRWQYMALQKALKLPLVAQPELLEQLVPACESAAWIWSEEKKLNAVADAQKFGECCYRWNGGYNGLDLRIKYWLRARRALGLS